MAIGGTWGINSLFILLVINSDIAVNSGLGAFGAG